MSQLGIVPNCDIFLNFGQGLIIVCDLKGKRRTAPYKMVPFYQSNIRFTLKIKN